MTTHFIRIAKGVTVRLEVDHSQVDISSLIADACNGAVTNVGAHAAAISGKGSIGQQFMKVLEDSMTRSPVPVGKPEVDYNLVYGVIDKATRLIRTGQHYVKVPEPFNHYVDEDLTDEVIQLHKIDVETVYSAASDSFDYCVYIWSPDVCYSSEYFDTLEEAYDCVQLLVGQLPMDQEVTE